MTLYYQDEFVELHHGDCRGIRGWTTADVLVTDPPYGVAYVSNASKRGSSRPIAGDDDLTVRDAVLQMWPDSKPALVFGSWKLPRPAATRHRLVWDKGDSPGMGDLAMPWGPGDEEIYVIGEGFTGKRRSNVIRANTMSASDHRRPDHPTPKPVALMESLIAYAPPGVIADPFAGSGATLIAARNLGRRAIGVEVEERYCELIVSRLAQQAFVFEGL
ncbi:DNA-methyltransferase [Microbacterium paraoxydans]